MALIASGDAPQRIVDEIKRREVQSKDLQAELARLRDAQPTRLDINRLRHVALERAKDLRSVLYTDVPKGRQALQQLLVAPITFKPDGPARRRNAVRGALCAGAFGNPHKAGVPTLNRRIRGKKSSWSSGTP